ncbi:amino acid ABC transporter membrane protein (PAAT family) [Jatrophihabitans sp. GAS493]|uniref:amino acid ABC transporter permease n=1 Tax=Jatrophihabitans sp. GAS493 TaxID=1907575 RepID=UPI000BB8B792|nr:amino acid ABC transporter permease [Jatrophihabitans sp. GAS493]SOD74863.1 amino acid ABC transporter membrane protein (PAAT family) [Jatrophihabitans sp. GAS493]
MTHSPPIASIATAYPAVEPDDAVASPAYARSLTSLDRRGDDDQLLAAKLVPLRRPGQWISAAIVLVLFAMLVHTLLTNHRFQWDVVGDYFTQASILHGLLLTLWLTASVMVCGYLLGIGLAAMRLSTNPILRTLSFGYVWLVRSVPPLVQLLFWYELASLYPTLSLGIPFGHEFVTVKTAHLFTGLLAAFVALTLDVAAFSAEIVRGGILAVEPGQTEAAQALGLGRGRIFRRIVLPQAMPAIIPASGNLLIGMLKATSIVSVIAVTDLLYSVQLIYNQNYLIMPLLLVATIWYIILTTLLSIGQYYVERHYARGSKRHADRGLWELARSNLPLFGRTRTDLAGLS